MSTDGHRRQKSTTPPGSGRESPVPKAATRRHVEEEPKKPDKTYKRYATGIDRALATFDAGRLEWPDYISFLGRLLKAVQAHPPAVEALPYSSGIAQRLAQCLNPSLPSGVHQKAIEVYSYIFSLIGKDAFARDLAIYLPGISSVLSFASLTLRPNFLSLIETHVLTLPDTTLRPALKALLLVLLPGLEDETSEDFDRALKDIDTLKDGINPWNDTPNAKGAGDEHFWQCFFLATISNRSRRQGALAYLTRRLPKLIITSEHAPSKSKHGNKEQPTSSLSLAAESVVSPEPGLLIRCFTAGLCDDQILLQRGFLDLLLTHLPLNSPVLTSMVGQADLDLLVTAATGVVSRRDMSLNRRLWSWFLGPAISQDAEDDSTPYSPNEIANEPDASASLTSEAYFERYGADSLIRSLLAMFHSPKTNATEAVKPFRTCLSLMDRHEIGGSMVSRIFLPAMESLLVFQREYSEEEFQEVLRSASGFFDGIEAGLIWAQIMKLITDSLTPHSSDGLSEASKLRTASFIINHFNVREEEMLMVHIPLSLAVLLHMIRKHEAEYGQDSVAITDGLWQEAGFLAEKMTQLVPETVFSNVLSNQHAAKSLKDQTQRPAMELVQSIELFYHEHDGNLEVVRPPMNPNDIQKLLLADSADLFISSLQVEVSPKIVDVRARIFSSLIAKGGDSKAFESQEMILAFKNRLRLLEGAATNVPRVSFVTLNAVIRVLMQFRLLRQEESDLPELSNLIKILVGLLWDHCTPNSPRHHVEAVRCLWQLDDIMPSGRVIEASISEYLAGEDTSLQMPCSKTESARRFAILWTHTVQLCTMQNKRNNSVWSKQGIIANDATSFQASRDYQAQLQRPLLLLLDILSDEDSEMSYFLTGWIQSLQNIQTVFIFLVTKLSLNQVLGLSHKSFTNSELQMQSNHLDDSLEGLYYLRKLLAVLRLCTDEMWASLNEETEFSQAASESDERTTLIEAIARLCLDTIKAGKHSDQTMKKVVYDSIQREALAVIRLLLGSPIAASLQNLSIEDSLVQTLRDWLSVEVDSSSIQVALLDTISVAMRTKSNFLVSRSTDRLHRRTSSVDTMNTSSRLHLQTNSVDLKIDNLSRTSTPSQLVKCLQEGITSFTSHLVLESWIKFLIDVFPFLENSIFQHLIPLVECFCKQIRFVFQHLMETLKGAESISTVPPESALMSLLNGLEYILATAHERLMTDETKTAVPKSPEPAQQGFFGNVVSGVFSSEVHKSRNAVANTKLTVILCLQDAFRICLSIWSWSRSNPEEDAGEMGMSASFAYIAVRLRNKTRRMLDRIFSSEPLESIETLVVAWSRQGGLITPASPSSLMHVLHVLDYSKPKSVMPTIFNAIYSRTNPSALDLNRMSTLTSDLADVELGQFLNEYTQSLDDDAMDEIWTDCMTFLRDVLTNPQVHHRILPSLLQFLVTLTEKIDNTNFGEQRKMRRDLSDIFMRLLAASFSGRTLAALQEPVDYENTDEKLAKNEIPNGTTLPKARPSDLVDVLNLIVPRLPIILADGDKLSSAMTTLSANFTSPVIHAKVFPDNIRLSFLQLFAKIAKITQAAKIWKKDVVDAFNHSKLFSSDLELVVNGWAPIFKQWSAIDKDRVSELCSRIAAPTSAGIMFGVGASAARLDADKKTQLNLRRVALLILSNEDDFVVSNLKSLEEKIMELQGATPASSPSSATRAEVFMVWQAVLVKTSSVHLASIWSTVTAELQKAIASSLPRSKDYDTYNTSSLLQACRLLDLLLLVGPDEFQLREWLFITDTIEAVYRPSNWEPMALIDEIAEEMGSSGMPIPSPNSGAVATDPFSSAHGLRHTSALLDVSGHEVSQITKDDLTAKFLRPFFAQLSINAYEATYSMRLPDLSACKQRLLEDLFDDATILG